MITLTARQRREYVMSLESLVHNEGARIASRASSVYVEPALLRAETIEEVMRAAVVAAVAALKALEVAENAVDQEANHDEARRVERDLKAAALASKVRYMRVRVDQDAGAAAVKLLGMGSKYPAMQNAVAQLRYAEAVLSALEAHPMEIVPELGAPYSTGDIAAQLAPLVADLEAALGAVAADTRETEQARRERDAAQAHYGRVVFNAAAIIEAFCRQADMPDVAERVRPSSRRISGRLNEDPLPAPGDPAPEADGPA